MDLLILDCEFVFDKNRLVDKVAVGLFVFYESEHKKVKSLVITFCICKLAIIKVCFRIRFSSV